jgi:hypothetical protein
MENMHSVSGPLGQVLQSRREDFNARFESRRRAGAKIDPTAFLHHLVDTVDPVIRAVHDRFPERVSAAVDVLYNLSLELFALNLLGPLARSDHVLRAWTDVLPAAPILVARDPLRAAGSLSNGAAQLASHHGTRPEEWLSGMRSAAGHCDSVSQWLECGKVLVWRAGMVQYRTAALMAARQLPSNLSALCFGLSESIGGDMIQRVIDQLADDPWLTPLDALQRLQSANPPTDRPIQAVGMIGDFVGFGGPFGQPPVVTVEASRLIATDGERVWQVIADVHGTHLHPLGKGSFQGNRRGASLSIDGDGIKWHNDRAVVPSILSPTSIAADEHTAAATCGASFFVFLLACKPRL